MNTIQANDFIAEELLGWCEYSEDGDMGWYKEDSVLADLWNKAELSIFDVAGHLRRKYGVIVN